MTHVIKVFIHFFPTRFSRCYIGPLEPFSFPGPSPLSPVPIMQALIPGPYVLPPPSITGTWCSIFLTLARDSARHARICYHAAWLLHSAACRVRVPTSAKYDTGTRGRSAIAEQILKLLAATTLNGHVAGTRNTVAWSLNDKL